MINDEPKKKKKNQLMAAALVNGYKNIFPILATLDPEGWEF